MSHHAMHHETRTYLTCEAGALAVSCACDFEAKQFESMPAPDSQAGHVGHAGAHDHR